MDNRIEGYPHGRGLPRDQAGVIPMAPARDHPTIPGHSVDPIPPLQPPVHRMLSLDVISSFAICGIAALAGEPMEQALSRADEALYRAKSGGRNQVQVGAAS